jgi:hypothetical protein
MTAVLPLRRPDDELDLLGPSWAAMSDAQRAAYGPTYAPAPIVVSLESIRDLVDLALQFPRAVQTDGLSAVAARWGEPAPVCELARALAFDHRGSVHVESPHRTVASTSPIRRRTPAWERDLAFAATGTGRP